MKTRFVIFAKSLVRRALACLVLLLAATSLRAQVYFTPLSGSTGASTAENYDALVDGNLSTKWCVNNMVNDGTTGVFIVMQATEAVQLTKYWLTTGNDVNRFPQRNWKTWRIYGANFESETLATRDAADWVLLDEKTNISSSQFIPTNRTTTEFTVSESVAQAFRYFKIEVLEVIDATSGSTLMEMSEFALETPASDIDIHYVTGKTDGNFGDGAPENFVDGEISTKWGGNAPTWAIYKTDTPIQPGFYTLTTGNDTQAWSDRNWREWQVWGANFESDDQATRDAAGWVLLDERSGSDARRLPSENYATAYFGFSGLSSSYQYYRIEIMNDGAQQMSEFGLFEGGESFPKVRNKFYTAAHMFDLSQPAERALVEDYRQAMEAIRSTADVESMMTAYMVCIEKQAAITASMNAYSSYANEAANILSQLYGGSITTEGISVLEGYLKERIEPNAQFPHGSYSYIIEQCTLSAEEIAHETEFVQGLVGQYTKLEDEDAIDVWFTYICGDPGMNDAESAPALMDRNLENKWCSDQERARTIGSSAWDAVFMASEAIMPRYYELLTGNDTGNWPIRNWIRWNIYGANLDVDETLGLVDVMDDNIATQIVNSDQWVLLDSREGDLLPAASFATASFYMNQNVTEKFRFFRIEILETRDNVQQMTELTLMNNGNLIEKRDNYVAEMEGVDLDAVAQASLIESFSTLLARLRDANSPTAISNYYNQLVSLRSQITASADAYRQYMDKVQAIQENILSETDDAYGFLRQYLEETVEPGNGYPHGSYPYIIEHRTLSVSQVQEEMYYVEGLYSSAQNGAYYVLNGSGDNFSANEGFAALVDGNWGTKWGCHGVTDTYVIFMTPTPQAPFFYTLVTGNDSDRFSGRNWKSWRIYGANFESASQAVKDAPQWVLIDQRENIGQDRLGAAATAPFYFGFSEGIQAEYRYYKVVVTAAYSGTDIQMSELTFGTQADFETLRDEMASEMAQFAPDDDVHFELSLLDDYGATLEKLWQSAELEEALDLVSQLKALQGDIHASISAYEALEQEKNKIEAYLAANPGMEGAACDLLRKYLGEDVAPGDDFPNGSYAYITAQQLLSAEQIQVELERLKGLFMEAVAAGYVAGADITMLLSNPDFSKGFTGWEGQAYGRNYGTGSYDGRYAAEVWNHGFNYHQTLTGLKNGIYLLEMDAVYRPHIDYPENTNLAAMIYANADSVYVTGAREEMIPAQDAVSHENCYLNWSDDLHDIVVFEGFSTDTLGYIPRGIQGAVYAFKGGRYHNRILTNVTDGTLTVGITDPGVSADNQWTGWGNVKLTYVGSLDEASQSLDETLEGQSARATTILDTETDEVQYRLSPNFSQQLRDELTAATEAVATVGTPAEKYTLVGTFSRIFNEIYSCKNSYIALMQAWDKVQDKWRAQILPDDMVERIYTTEDELLDNYELGAYTTAEALSRIAAIYEEYPDWLVANTSVAVSHIEVEPTGMFEYHVDATDNDPFLAFTGFYEDLSTDRTVLAFDYKSETDLYDGRFYFATNYIDATRELTYSAPKTTEWQSLYFDISKARSEWGWGSVSHWLRWDVTSNAGEGVSFDIRKVRIITEAQMLAEGGQFSDQEETEGEGTKENPYVVKTKADLAGLASKFVAGQMVYVVMEDDIDMAGVTNWKPLFDYPASTEEYPYPFIDFDGRNHVIRNLTCKTEGSYDYPGLFGVLCGNVRNLGIENADIVSAGGTGILGGYLGHSKYGKPCYVENVWVTGKLSASGYCGGMFGNIGGESHITNCYANVEVTGESDLTGGIAGRVRAQLELTNVYAAGTVNRGGGIIGGGHQDATPMGKFTNVAVWNNTEKNFGPTREGDVQSGILYYDGTNFADLQSQVVAWDPAVWSCDMAEGSYPVLKAFTTGIGSISAPARSGDIYDLSGRKLMTLPQKGVYIQNGKKRLVK